MARVLLVEDDDAIRSALARGLVRLDHIVSPVGNGAEAIAALTRDEPDVVLLDLGLPDMDGSAVLAVALASGPTPVIVVTARDEEQHIIRLLDAGADDYVVKPYSAAQIDARIRAVLRRAPTAAPESELIVGSLVLNPTSHTVALEGADIELSRKEFDLLRLLMEHPGEVLSKPRILAEVWRQPWGGADRTVDVHLSWLRRKLGESAAAPRYLQSVRGVGIKIVDPGD